MHLVQAAASSRRVRVGCRATWFRTCKGIPSSDSSETCASAFPVCRRGMCALIEVVSAPGCLPDRPAAHGRAAPRISEVHWDPSGSPSGTAAKAPAGVQVRQTRSSKPVARAATPSRPPSCTRARCTLNLGSAWNRIQQLWNGSPRRRQGLRRGKWVNRSVEHTKPRGRLPKREKPQRTSRCGNWRAKAPPSAQPYTNSGPYTDRGHMKRIRRRGTATARRKRWSGPFLQR